MKTVLKYTDPNTRVPVIRVFYSRADAENRAAELVLAGVAVVIKPRLGPLERSKP